MMPKVGGLPWSKFWWQDWQSDASLRSCSLAARGLWMEMLCIAASGTPRGYVTINSVSVTPKRLAILAGVSELECRRLTQELREAGVFSETPEGVIYNRRMVRDTEVAEAGRAAVQKRWDKRPDPTGDADTTPNRGPSTPEARSQKLEARGQKITTADAVASPPSGGDPPAAKLGPPIPLDRAVALWNEIGGQDLGRVVKLTDLRRKHLRARLVEHWPQDPLGGWRAYCQRIVRSDFLTGRKGSTGAHAGWKADFDWAVNAANAVKVIEGRYDNERNQPPPPKPGEWKPAPNTW